MLFICVHVPFFDGFGRFGNCVHHSQRVHQTCLFCVLPFQVINVRFVVHLQKEPARYCAERTKDEYVFAFMTRFTMNARVCWCVLSNARTAYIILILTSLCVPDCAFV